MILGTCVPRRTNSPENFKPYQLMAFRFSETSSVLLVFQAVESPVDRAPYEQRLNEYSSGGKSVRVVGSISISAHSASVLAEIELLFTST